MLILCANIFFFFEISLSVNSLLGIRTLNQYQLGPFFSSFSRDTRVFYKTTDLSVMWFKPKGFRAMLGMWELSLPQGRDNVECFS